MSVVSTLEVLLTANAANLNTGLRNAERSLSGFSSSAGRSIRNVGNTMSAAISAPLAAIAALSVRSAIQWESAFAGVVKTVDATDAELANLASGLRDLATSADSPVSALANAHTELARIAELAGQLGVENENILTFTETIGMLAMSTDLSAESAATMAAQFANITGMDMSDIERFGSAIVALGNNMATTESTILEFAQRLAGAGSIAGLSEADILALGAAMASVGLNAEAGGTAMTEVLNGITSAVATGGDALQIFANVAGTTATAFADMWSTNPVEALNEFITGLGTMSAGDQLAILDELGFSGMRTSDTLRRMAGAQGLLTDAIDIANTGWTENTALVDEAGKRAATTESGINRFTNNLNDLGIAIGSAVLPALNDIIAKLTEFVAQLAETNPEVIQAAVALGAVLIAAGPLTTIIGTIASVFGVLAGAVTAIGAPVLLVVAAFGGLLALGGGLDEVLAGLQATVGNFGDAIGALFSGDTLGAFESFKAGLQSIGDTIGSIVSGIGAGIDQLFGTGPDMSQMTPSQIVAGGVDQMGAGPFQQLADSIISLFGEGGFVRTAIEWVINTLSTIWDTVGPGVQSFADSIGEIFGWIVTNVITPLIEAITEVINKLNSLGGGLNALSGIGGNIDKINQAVETGQASGGDVLMAALHSIGAELGNQASISALQGMQGNATGALNIGPGVPSIVGERGPELFIPSGSGQLVPNYALGGGGNTYVINAYGQSPYDLARMIRRATADMGA